jgi:hypothetical protein
MSFESYDFEPRGNRMDSRDRDFDGVPDYWQPLSGPEISSYEAEKIRIVKDAWREGFFPNAPGHVLYMPFSGTRIGIRTLYPKAVDPQMAYEITAYVKTKRLNHSVVSIDVIWLRVDEKGEEQVVGDFDRLLVPVGQEDWTEAPLRRRINDLPPQANRVRIVCSIRDNPYLAGADRHGEAWFDDIKVESRPKIGIESEFRDDHRPLSVAISYQGLTANAGERDDLFAQGRRLRKVYSRRIEIRDTQGHLVTWNKDTIHERKLNPGRSTTMTEEIRLPELRQRGIYYVHVRLYGQAELKQDPQMLDQFGLSFDPLSIRGRTKYPEVTEIMRHAGVFRAKLEMWPQNSDQLGQQEIYLGIPPMLRALRTVGMRFTGVFGRIPATLAPEDGMLPAMIKRRERLWQMMNEPVLKLSPQIDDWQWGGDDDPSFIADFHPDALAPMRKRLREMTSAFTQAIPIPLAYAERMPPPGAGDALNIHVPAAMDEVTMVNRLLPLIPQKFARIVDWRREIYPTEDLRQLSEVGAKRVADLPRPTEDERDRPIWLSLEPMLVDPYLRQQRPEREQAIDLARKIILARMLGVERLYAGQLLHAQQGLAAVRRSGRIVPRPSLLALQTLSTYMSGTEFLGSFQLGGNIENYVYRRPGPNGTETALIAIWYNGTRREERVTLGYGLGDLRRIDMAGNEVSIPGNRLQSVVVDQMPILIDGMSVPLARTRMSIRIMPNPPLLSRIERQEQQLRIRNFFAEPLTGTLRLLYAVDERYSLEPGWVSPRVMRVNLPPGGEEIGKRVEIRRGFSVRPTLEAVLGRKYVQIETQLAAARESRFSIQRATELTSDLVLKPKPRLIPSSSPEEKMVRLSIGWQPDPRTLHAPRLDLRPYYQVLGDQPYALSRMTVYPGKASAIRDIRIPFVQEGTRVWVGATEESGSRFVRFEVTHLIHADKE